MQGCNFTKIKKRLRDSEVDCFWTIPVYCFWDFTKNSKLSPFLILEATVFEENIRFERMLIEKLKYWNIFLPTYGIYISL